MPRFTPPRARRSPRSSSLVAGALLSLGALGAPILTSSNQRASAVTVRTASITTAATTSTTAAVDVLLADNATKAVSGVKVKGNTVTIATGGTYRLHGSLSNGQVVVDAKDAIVQLLFDGVSVTSSTTSALYVSDADQVIVTLVKGTTSSLTDATSYVRASASDTEPDAALFSKDDLTITGEGTLRVNGRGGDAIVSKDKLLISGGTVVVSAADDAIRGKDSLTISGGTITIDAKGDGLKSTEETDANAGLVSVTGGSVTIKAGTDGIDAAQTVSIAGGSLVIAAGDDGVHSDGKVDIHGGSVKITTSYEGVEGKSIVIAGGTVDLVASDDGINVASGTAASGGFGGGRPGGGGAVDPSMTFTMSAGTASVSAAGDGFDINGNATITGGTLIVNGPTDNGNAALDVDGSFQVSGGTVLGAGSAGMAMAPASTSKQASINLEFENVQPVGTVLQLRSSAGKVVLTFEVQRPTQSLVFSSALLTKGASYTVWKGGKATGSSLRGYYASSAASGGANVGTVTI